MQLIGGYNNGPSPDNRPRRAQEEFELLPLVFMTFPTAYIQLVLKMVYQGNDAASHLLLPKLPIREGGETILPNVV